MLLYRHEKKMFDKYQKAARAGPDKKEREEIENLKAQVCYLLVLLYSRQIFVQVLVTDRAEMPKKK
jgi:hypothetical protein